MGDTAQPEGTDRLGALELGIRWLPVGAPVALAAVIVFSAHAIHAVSFVFQRCHNPPLDICSTVLLVFVFAITLYLLSLVRTFARD
jgi:hypothetical protein